MAIYNVKTGERRLVGQIIKERGTFRMDTSMDEVTYWCTIEKRPKIEYFCQGDWYVERGSDLSEENEKAYNDYDQKRWAEWKERQAINEAKTLKFGSVVRVFKGRKVKIGTVGKVVQYFKGPSYTTVYLVDDSGMEHKTYLSNLEILVNDVFINDIYSVA